MKRNPLITLVIAVVAAIFSGVKAQDVFDSGDSDPPRAEVRQPEEAGRGSGLKRTAFVSPRASLVNPGLTDAGSRIQPPPSRIRLLPPEEVLSDRLHDIVLDEARGFNGRIYSITATGLQPAPGMNVQLLSQGELLGESATDNTGRFRFTGVETDENGIVIAGIIATGPAGLVVYGARLVEPTPEKPGGKEIVLDTTSVPASEYELARAIIYSGIGTRDLRFNRPLLPDDLEFNLGAGEDSTSVNYHSARIAEDGRVYGQVNLLDERTGRYREVLSMRVYFLKDGVEAGSARVAPNGAFSVPGLEPGIYGWVGSGRDGVFGIGLEVLPPRENVQIEGRGDAVPVRMDLAVLDTIAIAPITAANLNSGNLATFLRASTATEPGGEAESMDTPANNPAGNMALGSGTLGGTSGGASVGEAGFGTAATNTAIGIGSGFLIERLISEFE